MKWILGCIFLLVSSFLIFHWSITPLKSVKSGDPMPIQEKEARALQPRKREPIIPSHRPSKSDWKAFQEKSGNELSATYLPDGRISSIRGAPLNAIGIQRFGSPTFDPKQSDQAIIRAKEILSEAKDLLGLREDAPLGSPQVVTGNVSAQVYFKELVGGVPLSPYGRISIDLGPHGELLNLQSDYFPTVPILNQVKITAEEARSAVGRPSEGGSPIVWMSGGHQGRRAYEFFVQGRQVIVDAETGHVITQKDKRIF